MFCLKHVNKYLEIVEFFELTILCTFHLASLFSLKTPSLKLENLKK